MLPRTGAPLPLGSAGNPDKQLRVNMAVKQLIDQMGLMAAD